MANNRPKLMVFSANHKSHVGSKKMVATRPMAHLAVTHRPPLLPQRSTSLQSLMRTNVTKVVTCGPPQLVLKSAPVPQRKPVTTPEPHKQIRIKENSTGYSYSNVFGGLLDEKVTAVRVDDPYVRTKHQVINFLRFCELLVKRCRNLRLICLRTTEESDNSEKLRQQKSNLAEVQRSLQNHRVRMDLRLSNTLHDREIAFDNGWVVKIGRGLDYFKRNDSKFGIGVYDQDLRQCLETTVDIFHSRHVKI